MDASGPATAALAADDDQRAVVGEDAAEPGHRPVAADVEDDVVALAILADVAVRVVDDVIGSQRPHEVQLLRARHGRDVRSEGLGDLHGEGPDASRCADHEDVLTCLHTPMVAQRLKSRDGRDRHGGGLLEAQVRRHPRELVRFRARRTRQTKHCKCRTPPRPVRGPSPSHRPPRRPRPSPNPARRPSAYAARSRRHAAGTAAQP